MWPKFARFRRQSGPCTQEHCGPPAIDADALSEMVMREKPGEAFGEALRTGVLGRDLPEVAVCATLSARSRRKSLLDHSLRVCEVIRPELHLRLAGLLHDIGKPNCLQVTAGRLSYPEHAAVGAGMARQVLVRLGYGADIADRVAHLICHHMFQLHSYHSDRAIGRWVRNVGADEAADVLELRRADIVGTSEAYWAGWADFSLLTHRVNHHLRADAEARASRLPVNGRDVMDILGIAPGPEVGAVLAELQARVDERPDLCSREVLLGLLRDRL